ncbi:cyclin-like protein [Amylocarpus encephaloides]|uniref:Cyclin-like protein n=1 Tax=Amylocarpus encephaloides TaxID=45428 RepID=A0A9P7YE40_9HELO|nr:cyclin-like protein [Amylocarpus encephaloides]
MSHLFNPLVTAEQLYQRRTHNDLPVELQDRIRFDTARLTHSAGILLRLPQDITAQANVLLFRYWTVDNLRDHEFNDASAATIYLTAKISASPRSLRSVANVYKYLLTADHDSSSTKSAPHSYESHARGYYFTEGEYQSLRGRLLTLEGQILNALGFNTHVALPHPLAITYLQTLDIFSPSIPKHAATEISQRTVQYLNTALMSPQMLYLTHQPPSLATAAIYLAAKEVGVTLPDVEWWEVFDCEREELGFLVMAMGSLDAIARGYQERDGAKGMITRMAIDNENRRSSLETDNTTPRV